MGHCTESCRDGCYFARPDHFFLFSFDPFFAGVVCANEQIVLRHKGIVAIFGRIESSKPASFVSDHRQFAEPEIRTVRNLGQL